MASLSILMSTYNDALYLEEAVDSIIKQSFENWELLICDDGSTDDTRALLTKYHDHSKITVFYNAENKGKSVTINQLLECSTGTYISVHDADDWSDLDRFKIQIAFLEAGNYKMCGCAFYKHTPDDCKIVRMPRDYNVIRSNLPEISQFHGPTVVFRRDIIDDVGGLFRDFTWGEDIDFTSRVVEKYQATNIPDVLYHYRIHSDSLTNDISRLHYSRFANKKLREILHKQRQISGVDMLMEGRQKDFEKLREEVIKEMELNPSEVYWNFSQRLHDLDLHEKALKSSYLAMRAHVSYKNFKNLIFMFCNYLSSWCQKKSRKRY